jgi:hypothetical protein
MHTQTHTHSFTILHHVVCGKILNYMLIAQQVCLDSYLQSDSCFFFQSLLEIGRIILQVTSTPPKAFPLYQSLPHLMLYIILLDTDSILNNLHKKLFTLS